MRSGRTEWYDSHLPSPPGYVSTSQWIGIGTLLAGVLVLLVVRKLQPQGYKDAVAEAAQAA